MDKATYWSNRKAGKRGQGIKPILRKESEDYIHPRFYEYNRAQRHEVIPSDPSKTKKRITRG